MIDFRPLLSAFHTVRRELLALRVPAGHWVGELSSSAFATASAASALCIVARAVKEESHREAYQQLACRSVDWLVAGQNSDGGWGDTRSSPSNLAATMLVRAAVHLAAQSQRYADSLARAQRWFDSHDGLAGLKRQYGGDPSMLAAILGNSALAGLTAWRDAPAMAFELAWLPPAIQRLLGASPSYADPVRVGIGQARFFHRRPRNPLTLLARQSSIGRSLARLGRMQPASGGFLEAVPWTSFVVMGLASTGRVDHPVARRGLGFLLDTVRGDASWSISTNLSVWNTALSINALASASGDVGALGCLDWLLGCQRSEMDQLTETPPGGWGCNDTRGSPPDVDGTSTALLALSVLLKSGAGAHRPRIEIAAAAGINWLLAEQNDDGGWPTFYRGSRRALFDGSGADLTAHALRALRAWQYWIADRSIDEAIRRGMDYLAAQQRSDGSWRPLWFGNPNYANEENPVYGTSQVLSAYRDLDQIESLPAQHGLEWLTAAVDPGGGWGGGQGASRGLSSVEETALAVEALLAAPSDLRWQAVLEAGLQWIIRAVQESRHRQTTAIGLHMARLWYYDKVYPLAFTVSALGQAVKLFSRPA
ncbi:MAG: prenyltransferase/squalene oxidase repeat-containing protein [Thermoguttaceae bacterium]|jgi:squalene-hopene/tetraprenyl-beta-curcumene cyclase